MPTKTKEEELAQKLKNLRTNFERDFAVLEKALLEVRKNLQLKLDKNKLAKLKKSL